MRNISAVLTKAQIYESARRVAIGKAPIKDVTRRHGWWNLKVGERLQFCEQCQGIPKGGSMVRICVVEVVAVRAERLDRMLQDRCYGARELIREGFGFNHPTIRTVADFVNFYCLTHKGVTPETEINRIEFKYIV